MTIEEELDALADPAKAKVLRGFFKTGRGEYGEGDRFLGIRVPDTRRVAKRHADLGFPELQRLLDSPIHEYRFAALLILLERFRKADGKGRKEAYGFYLRNAGRVNSWDLVDLSAEKIVGPYIEKGDRTVLRRLARSSDLWERRIAILSTFHFIKKGDFDDTLRVAEILLDDPHDLIHKAVGWMLREVGKRGGLREEKAFLEKHHRRMPRTMLRYAIERFSPRERARYL